MDLSGNLYNAGPAGILFAIWLIWSFSAAPKTLKKLFNAKGFNSKFWKDL
jgi:hypothetical protein